jgi:hypothetical protein
MDTRVPGKGRTATHHLDTAEPSQLLGLHVDLGKAANLVRCMPKKHCVIQIQ